MNVFATFLWRHREESKDHVLWVSLETSPEGEMFDIDCWSKPEFLVPVSGNIF